MGEPHLHVLTMLRIMRLVCGNVVLAVFSARHHSINWLVSMCEYILWLQCYGLMKYHSLYQPFSEHHQLLGTLSCYFTPKIGRDQHKFLFRVTWDSQSPILRARLDLVFTPNVMACQSMFWTCVLLLDVFVCIKYLSLTLDVDFIQQCAAELCRSVCVLQEVHGAVFSTEYRTAHDRPHAHLPEVPQGIRTAHTSQ